MGRDTYGGELVSCNTQYHSTVVDYIIQIIIVISSQVNLVPHDKPADLYSGVASLVSDSFTIVLLTHQNTVKRLSIGLL